MDADVILSLPIRTISQYENGERSTISPWSDEMAKHRRRNHRDLRPETTTTSARVQTKVKEDQRVKPRFSIGERVAWDGGGSLVLATVKKYDNNACIAVVLTDDGRWLTWPITDARVRRIQTSSFEPDETMTQETEYVSTVADSSSAARAGVRGVISLQDDDDDDYESIDLMAEPMPDPIDLPDEFSNTPTLADLPGKKIR